MKVVLITDTHFGARNDNRIFQNYFNRFYHDIFFPELFKREIKTVIHLGDLVDRRRTINFVTLDEMKNNFINVLVENNIDTENDADNECSDSSESEYSDTSNIDIIIQDENNTRYQSDSIYFCCKILFNQMYTLYDPLVRVKILKIFFLFYIFFCIILIICISI